MDMPGVQNLAKYGKESNILSEVPKFFTALGRAAYYGYWHRFLGKLMHDSRLDGVVLCAVGGGQVEFLDKFFGMFAGKVLSLIVLRSLLEGSAFSETWKTVKMGKIVQL